MHHHSPFLLNRVWNRAMPPGKHSLLKAVAKWQGRQTYRRLKVGTDAYILQGCYINTTTLKSLFVFPQRALDTETTDKTGCALYFQQFQFQNLTDEKETSHCECVRTCIKATWINDSSRGVCATATLPLAAPPLHLQCSTLYWVHTRMKPINLSLQD